MKPETNYRKKTEKKTNTWYLIRKQFYANKSDNLEKVDKFLETYSLLRLSQEETDNLHRQITTSEIGSVIKNKTPCKKKSRAEWLLQSYKYMIYQD